MCSLYSVYYILYEEYIIEITYSSYNVFYMYYLPYNVCYILHSSYNVSYM